MNDPIVQAFRSLLDQEGGATTVAAVIGANPASLYQIYAGIKLPSGKPKGVGKQLREKLERHYPGWLSFAGSLGGTVETIRPGSSESAQATKGLVQRMAPPKIGWEALMTVDDLPHEFETQLPDNAMAPDAPRGTRCIFVAGESPDPGDWVLVRDGAGHMTCRVYRLLRPGQWEAHALNPSFLPMESSRDNLEVVAVFDGMRGRKSAT